MKWTHDKPQVSGWYWYMKAPKDDEYLEIVHGAMGICYVDMNLTWWNRRKGLWAGPIEAPVGGDEGEAEGRDATS